MLSEKFWAVVDRMLLISPADTGLSSSLPLPDSGEADAHECYIEYNEMFEMDDLGDRNPWNVDSHKDLIEEWRKSVPWYQREKRNQINIVESAIPDICDKKKLFKGKGKMEIELLAFQTMMLVSTIRKAIRHDIDNPNASNEIPLPANEPA